MEQQTPTLPPPPPPPRQIKDEAAQKPKRVIFLSLIFLGGRGGKNVPSILSKIVASCFTLQLQNYQFRNLKIF